jgi:hypothetical protein
VQENRSILVACWRIGWQINSSCGFRPVSTQLLFLEVRSLEVAVKGDRDVPVGPASHVPRCCNPLPFSYLIKNQKEKGPSSRCTTLNLGQLQFRIHRPNNTLRPSSRRSIILIPLSLSGLPGFLSLKKWYLLFWSLFSDLHSALSLLSVWRTHGTVS